jgi:hypothetical protein
MPQPAPPPPPFWRNRSVLGIATIVGAIAAALAIPAFNSQAPTISVDGSVGGCIQSGSTNPQCTIEQQVDEASKNAADARHLEQLVESFSKDDPVGPAPWSFLVYNTKDQAGNEIGLKVKAEPTMEGAQIGSARGRSLVWGECYASSSYNPEVGSDVDVGPKWLRVRWPTSTPSSAFADSSPYDAVHGYVYAGYALPFKHDGTIPDCSNEPRR